MTDVPSITGAPQTPLAGLTPTRQPGWRQLQDAPLLVLVGVTGVGKSTALSALPEFGLLPDRPRPDRRGDDPAAGGPPGAGP